MFVILPPECGGGPHSSTTPCPSRTDTEPLLCVLKFSRSGKECKNQKNAISLVQPLAPQHGDKEMKKHLTIIRQKHIRRCTGHQGNPEE